MNLSYHHLFQPGTDSAAPPLLLLHGTGGNEHDLVPLARQLSPGSALLSPRGDVNEHGARRFFARLAEGVFDPAEVTRRTHALADFITTATAHHGIAPGRLLAVGFSNGANIAATLLQLRPETLAGAVLLRPMVVLDQSAAAGSLTGKRILIASGTHDPIVPPDHPARLAALLRVGGADATLHSAPAGHNLTSADLAAAQDFLVRR
ncbi:MAG: alpha/beta hydrolase [Opitutaceae bacterium]|nr:alpha/beta hydrolase [Opitutaceae bacterium]